MTRATILVGIDPRIVDLSQTPIFGVSPHPALPKIEIIYQELLTDPLTDPFLSASKTQSYFVFASFATFCSNSLLLLL